MDGLKNWQKSTKLMIDRSFEFARDPKNIYKPRDDDIIIFGPPKSGTTWLQQILHQLKTKGDESYKDISDVSWFLVANGTAGGDFDVNAEQSHKPRIFKHHEAYGVIPTTPKQKKIVIIRDPYDASYSLTKFINRWFGGNEDVPDDIMAKKIAKMNHIDKIASWWAERNRDPNLLFVFYEDLSKNLRLMIRQIAEFVELPLTDHELESIYGLCTFDYMVKHKEKFKHLPVSNIWAKSLGVPNWTVNIGMVREGGGQMGQGIKNAGPKVRATVDQQWAKSMEHRFGYKNYREMYNENSALKNNLSKL